MAEHGVREVYLFGSYARGEANNSGDVDIYCEPKDVETFVDQRFLEDELTDALEKGAYVIFIGTKLDDCFRSQLDEDKIRLG